MGLKSALSLRGPRPTGVVARLVKGLVANAAGKAWVVLSQIVTIPTLTFAWGAKEYGTWLIISTIPTYIALGDFGFGSAAAVEMTRRYSQADKSGALAVFQSAWVLISTFVAIAIAALIATIILSPTYIELLPTELRADEIFIAAALLSLYSFFAVQMAVINSAFRACGYYSRGTLLLDLVMPAEMCALVATALLGGRMVAVALALLIVRSIACVSFYWFLRRHEPWISIGYSHADVSELKRLLRPSLASLALTASGAISLQGVVVAIGFVFSPTAAAVFNAARTVTRIPVQLIGLIVRASIPEMTRAHSLGDLRLFSRLMSANVGVAILISLIASGALFVFGRSIVLALSHGTLHAEQSVVIALTLAMAAHVIWSTIAQAFVSINQQHVFSHHYLVFAIAPIILISTAHTVITLTMVGYAIAFVEFAMLLILSLRLRREVPRFSE